MDLLEQTLAQIRPADTAAMEQARQALDYLLKPPGSLGKLEEIARQLAGISGQTKNKITRKRILVMAADNGVTAENISAFPNHISFLVADTMLKGLSGVAVLARQAGATLTVVDLGLLQPLTTPGVISRRIRPGTSNIALGPAMSRAEARQAVETGIEVTEAAIAEGVDLLGTGEVGIGNTTTSSAVLAAVTGEDPALLVGRGTGVDDATLARKLETVSQALRINAPDPQDPLDILAKVGGFDLAGLTGCFLAAAARRIPIVIDGFISGVAAVMAWKLQPDARACIIPSHGSTEPGMQTVCRLLGLEPMLQMQMRLGEGTGCALAFPLIEAATAMINKMGTFGDIGL